MSTSFWRRVAVVLSGAAVAQAIPLLGSLVLARQYAPAEFGIFAAWLGFVLFLAVMLSGRFEIALAVEPDGERRRAAMFGTLATIALTSAAAGFLVAVVTISMVWAAAFPPVLVACWVPAAAGVAMAQAWQSWAAAEGHYRQLSVMRIVQAAAVTLLQIAAGVVFGSSSALAAAHFLGVLMAVAVSARLLPLGGFPTTARRALIADFWRRQRRFPLLSLPADAISAAAAQLPAVIVAARFGADVAGLFSITQRVLGAPIGLLGRSVLDVFKRHAARSFRERGECRREYLRTFYGLGIGSLIFVGVMAVSSEMLFAAAFGERWRGAGTLAVWLLPLYALRFVASPLSYMVYITGKQHLDLVWQMVLLATMVAALSLPERVEPALLAYSSGCSVLYGVYLVLSYRLSLGSRE